MAGGWGVALMLMCFEDVLDLLAEKGWRRGVGTGSFCDVSTLSIFFLVVYGCPLFTI